MAITKAEINKMERKTQSAYATLKRYREKEKGAVAKVVNGAVAVGTAFGLGFFENRYADRSEILGMPVSLVVASTATLADIMMEGQAGDAIGAIGVGSLAAYGYKEGARFGQKSLAASRE